MDLLVNFPSCCILKPSTWSWLRGVLRKSEEACMHACGLHGDCGLKQRTVETLWSVLVGIWISVDFFCDARQRARARGAISDFRQFVTRRFTDFGVAYGVH